MKSRPDQLSVAAKHCTGKIAASVNADIVTVVVFIERGSGLCAMAHNGEREQVYRALREVMDSEKLVVRADA